MLKTRNAVAVLKKKRPKNNEDLRHSAGNKSDLNLSDLMQLDARKRGIHKLSKNLINSTL